MTWSRPSALHQLLFSPCCASCRCPIWGCALPICHVCYAKLEHPGEIELRQSLNRTNSTLEILLVSALWYYELNGPVRALHRRLKYREGYRLGLYLGEMIGEYVRHQSLSSDLPLPDLIAPIPAHTVRIRERGFNQAAVLAQGISASLSIPVSETLFSRRELKKSQVNLDIEERINNLEGAFVAHHDHLPTKTHLLLVDDVLTTGATLNAAVNALSELATNIYSFATLAFSRPAP